MKYMDCILISSSENVSLSRLPTINCPIFYTQESKVNFDRNYTSIDLDESSKRRINYDILDRINNWGNKCIDNITYNDLLSFNGFNYWQYHRFRMYFHIRNIEYEIQILNKLKQKGYSKVHLVSDYNYNPEDFISSLKFSFQNITKSKSTNLLTKVKYIAVLGVRVIIGLLNKYDRNTKHIITDSSLKQPCLKADGKLVNDNYVLGYLFDKLDHRFTILEELMPPSNDKTFKIKKELILKTAKDRNVCFSDIILFRGITSKNVRTNFKRIKLKIKSKLNTIRDNQQDPYDNLILNTLGKFDKSNSLYLLRYLSYIKYFKSKKIKSVTATDENGPISRTILDAAKYVGITTIGIQHGAIHRLHPNYYYSKAEAKYTPDYTFLWGKKWSTLLSDIGSYTDQSMIITGQIRTDIIPSLIETNDNNAPFTVVFASQPQRDPKLREQTAIDIFKAVANIGDVHLKVKLHPNEQNDVLFYSRIAESVSLTNYEILVNTELYLTLSSADIVITSFSTVGTEAIYFHKPLIIYDPLLQDIQEYYKEGVAFQAVSSEDIQNYMINIRNGKQKINKKLYNRFIENNAFKIDGKVADRCLGFYNSIAQ